MIKNESIYLPYPHKLLFGGPNTEIALGLDAQGNLVLEGDALNLAAGTAWYVDGANGSNSNNGRSWATAFATITAAHTAASAKDRIYIAEADYDEAITITKGLTLIGVGGRGAVAIAPSATDAIAVTIEGTALSRNANTTLINIGGEGNGTGGGLHVKGNIRRFRAYGCKFEGGAFAGKLESTAAGSVGDSRIVGNEFCWSTVGISITVSGGGDPVTQSLIENNLFHNITTDVIVGNAVAPPADLWILRNTFANQENGTEPTQYLDIDDANTTGLVAGNYFATTLHDSAKIAIAAGVLYVGNFAQAEGPATGGGTSGRPDA